ncbi:hypothetical protein EB796_015604 [Bugula neritina]|uniref:Uncharacterized protein n=1 Tax=Bugula neritina TaxID=10212 RepID=A0A7J7JJU9_BUGNE|nr:hypothetical protein EB796_015604 [Bugula neritina]
MRTAAKVIISLLLLLYYIEMNTALVCPQYWESQMECSCFHGCFKCSDITENYDIEQCLEVCKDTGALLVDQPACLGTNYEDSKKRKRRHINKKINLRKLLSLPTQ